MPPKPPPKPPTPAVLKANGLPIEPTVPDELLSAPLAAAMVDPIVSAGALKLLTELEPDPNCELEIGTRYPLNHCELQLEILLDHLRTKIRVALNRLGL